MTGTYTDIFHIEIPVTAKAGDIITAGVAVQNIASSNMYVTMTGRIDGTDVYFGDEVKYMGVSGIATFYETFTMPDHDVTIIVWSYARASPSLPWGGFDDTMQVSVDLEGAPAGEIAGEIISVKVMVGSLEQPIPASGIDVADKFLLRVKVKNTGTASYRPYLYYRYTKPDGTILGSTEAKFLELDPGDYHTFSEPAFGIPVDQSGSWYVYCELRDDYNGNVLDTFSKALIFNAGGEAPILTGKITNVRLKEGLITKDLPAPDMVKNDYFSVLVYVKNTSSQDGTFYCDCAIIKPSGAITGRTNEQKFINAGQEHIYEIQPEGFGVAFRIDETGDWYVECVLRSESEDLDSTPSTHLFTAGSEGATSDLQVYDIEATLPSTHPVLGPGDPLDVGVTFKYTSTEDTEVQLWASLSLPPGRDIEAFETIQLTKSLTENEWSGDITVQVPTSGVVDGEYTLKVETDGVETTILGAVTLVGMPTTGIGQMGEMIGMLVLMMVMTMIMDMMTSPEGFMATGAKYVEKGKEVAAPIIKIFAGRGE